jgi:biopolymer transport protein ExbD
VLVLLIVFMITVPSIVATRGVQERKLRLATGVTQASSVAPLTARKSELAIRVDARGRYSVEGAAKSPAQLDALLREQAARPVRTVVLIQADRRCDWQAVATVVNLCQRAKVHQYRLLTADVPASS